MDGAIEISMMPRCGLEASSTSYTTGEGSIRDWIIFRRSSSKRKSKRELSNLQRQNRWCHRSSPLANVAYKRSWCENFWRIMADFQQRKKKEAKKKEKFGRGDLLKLPQPWKSGQGGLRRHLIGGFPPLLEKASAQNALAFSQLQQVRRRLTLIRDHLIDFSCLSFGVRSIRYQCSIPNS